MYHMIAPQGQPHLLAREGAGDRRLHAPEPECEPLQLLATVVAMLRACALPEWTREDAEAWWSAEGAAKPARRTRATESAATLGASDLLGTTLEIDFNAR